MNKKEIKEILSEVNKYLLALPKDYCLSEHSKLYEEEGREKVWIIEIKLTRKKDKRNYVYRAVGC